MKKIILTAISCLLLVVSCYKEPAKPELPKIALSSTQAVLFDAKAGDGAVLSTDITLTVNRDWSIQCDADWLAFGKYASGQVYKVEAGVDTEIPVRIIAQTNRVGNVRKAVVRFKVSTGYCDLMVQQKMNEDEAPSLIYYNGFGDGLQGLDNPELDKTNLWRCEEGVAGDVRYYLGIKGGKLSVRETTKSEDCYVGASGGNNLFFGADVPAFTVAEIDVHKKLKTLNIGFGALYADGSLALADLAVYISRDGESWKSLDYRKISEYEEPKWCWCEGQIYFEPESFEHLYIMFKPSEAVKSKFRLDDVKISSDLSVEQVPADKVIDWTSGAQTIAIGEEILKK